VKSHDEFHMIIHIFCCAFQDVLNRPADEFGNDNMLEELWAKRAFEHAELHFNLLCSVDPKLLKLSEFDE
jgi:hypothetical protein